MDWSEDELPDIPTEEWPPRPPQSRPPRPPQPTKEEIKQMEIQHIEKKMAEYQLTREAKYHREACVIYDFINEHCAQLTLPPAQDTIYWSTTYLDDHIGQAFGSAPHQLLKAVVLSPLIDNLQCLFTVITHEMCHALNLIRGDLGPTHGRKFHLVLTEVCKSLNKCVHNLSTEMNFNFSVDKKEIGRARPKTQ